MDREFWLAAWRDGRTGFHSDTVHPDLVAFGADFLAGGPHRVLVPLCGKSHDLEWIAAHGHEVVGVELAAVAVMELMRRLDPDPELDRVGGYVRHRAGRVSVLHGDWFDAHPRELGAFDRMWDRAALVAVAPDQRQAYVDVARTLLAPDARVLLNTFSYDQALMPGPPFSVDEGAVAALWDGWTAERLRHDVSPAGRFAARGLDTITTNTWMISPRG